MSDRGEPYLSRLDIQHDRIDDRAEHLPQMVRLVQITQQDDFDVRGGPLDPLNQQAEIGLDRAVHNNDVGVIVQE